MLFKIIILGLLLLVIYNLAMAAVPMIKGDTSDKMVRSLTWRIGLSVFIFILLLVGQALGLITPHSL